MSLEIGEYHNFKMKLSQLAPQFNFDDDRETTLNALVVGLNEENKIDILIGGLVYRVDSMALVD